MIRHLHRSGWVSPWVEKLVSFRLDLSIPKRLARSGVSLSIGKAYTIAKVELVVNQTGCGCRHIFQVQEGSHAKYFPRH